MLILEGALTQNFYQMCLSNGRGLHRHFSSFFFLLFFAQISLVLHGYYYHSSFCRWALDKNIYTHLAPDSDIRKSRFRMMNVWKAEKIERGKKWILPMPIKCMLCCCIYAIWYGILFLWHFSCVWLCVSAFFFIIFCLSLLLLFIVSFLQKVYSTHLRFKYNIMGLGIIKNSCRM